MIARVIAWSARNKLLVILLTLVAVGFAVQAVKTIPLDAIPDLSDTQVIVYSRWDRSPDVLEDQVTYPIVTSLLGAPKVKAIRGFSDFGYSFVYIIFEDGTDLYWARSRVVEYLSKILPRLPEGVRTEIGPDATGVGWVYQYALVDRTGRHDLAELRSFQDWYLRYWLQSVPGVAEVASIGGYQKQYQVQVRPERLRAYGVSLERVIEAVRDGNAETSGRLVEIAGSEFTVRGRGYAKSVADLESIALGASASGTPILVRDVAEVSIGPEMRRGIADLDGRGDAVGGIVVMRSGENALNVIERVKSKMRDVHASLPEGVEIVPTYDRSGLIVRSIHTLEHELILALVIVSLVVLIFLWHIPSAIVPIVTIPISVLLAFIPMSLLGVTSNIMSLAGIAISIGVLVDGAIVEVENAYKKLEIWQHGGGKGDFHAIRLAALQEVGPSVFFSLLVIAVAFLPIFTLVDQEGRLFKPLAYTKNLAMAIAAILAITFDPAVRMMFTRMHESVFRPRWAAWLWNRVTVGTYYPEERHPVSRVLFAVYEPVCDFVLRWRKTTIAAALLLVAITVPAYFKLGREFMPPLDEGDLVYMPITLPGVSVTEMERVLQRMDALLADTPEVIRVYGKAGRAETSTDPAPLSMVETTVMLKPMSRWRPGMTREKLEAELHAKLQLPGVTNAWVMPIRNRIDMLSTGIRTPIGVKIFGGDLAVIEEVGASVEAALRDVPGTRSVFAERTTGGNFLDFDLKRDALARFGLSVRQAETAITSAIGGEPVTTILAGRERYGVSVRYPRELRDDPSAMRQVLISLPSGGSVPLEQIAEIRTRTGPAMIRDENGLLAGYVFVDVAGRDIGGYVEEAKRRVAASVHPPAGTSLQWSGQYENMERVKSRLKLVVPLTLAVIIVLLYLNTKSAAKTTIVMLAVPFSAVGAVWLLAALGYNVSIATWVGLIALMGLDAETGVFMLLFLDLAYDERVAAGTMRTKADLREAIIQGAVKRVRPKLMTVTAAFAGLLPIMFSTGTGADMMKRVAAPMIGGLVTSFILELLVYPPVYAMWRGKSLPA
ncbi:MAG TPA: CusA/CzcA family heavy metal efflux RND transporter [Candidatus Polarisedimenticolaceae bacterium]|nr:CusA/CzcA family heavy metal efflux RND transporter [Candidatus Polarisedimenticolaceae bacterium]